MAVISNNIVSFDYNLKNTTIKKIFGLKYTTLTQPFFKFLKK